MRATLGRKGAYSLLATTYLAGEYGDGRRKAREIAEAMDFTGDYLHQVLANLVNRGVLIGVAGPDGGYELARPPGEITVLQVIESAEGPVDDRRCPLSGEPCSELSCGMHEPWTRTRAAIRHELGRVTLAMLVRARPKRRRAAPR
jgi:Rrf2 family transcriptional regulator, cysteine metabolism repressor